MNCPKCHIGTTVENDGHRCSKCNTLYFEQTIHPVREDDGLIMYRIVPGDGSDSYLIGEFWEVEALCRKLRLLVEQGVHDGFLPPDDERIAQWLTVREAAELSGLRRRTVQWACQHGRIEGARPGPWRFTLQAFRRWRHSKAVKRRGHKTGS